MVSIFHRVCTVMFSVCMIFSLVVLIPVNINGSVGQTGLDSISMSNIEGGSTDLWAHLISCYAFALVLLCSMQYTYKKVKYALVCT